MKSLCLALVAALGLAGCASLAPTGRVPVEGGMVAYSRVAQVDLDATVVFQSGLGDGRSTWAGLVQDLAKQPGPRTVALFAYDRPGYGASSSVDGPRDPCRIAAEMRQVLQASGAKPPYVLVGHSLGGLYQYVYARLYPEDVAGMVLLDPTHPRHLEALRNVPSAEAILRVVRATLFSRTERAELDDQASCLDRLDHDRPLGIPVQILVSTRFSAIESRDFQAQVLWPLREDWLRLTGAQGLVRVDAGHYIHRDAPQAVMQAIRAAQERLPAVP